MERRTSTWTTTSTQPVPSAFVTKGKQRIKQHDGIVYLKDKEEFEIELYNPQSVHQLAKIKLNGKYIKGGGIVLKPGQRVFLERFLDSSDKFVFNTYTVGKTEEIKQAIQNNGDVQIEFFKEQYVPQSINWVAPNWQQTPPFDPNISPYWGNNTGNPYPYSGGLNTTNYSSSDTVFGTTSMNVSSKMGAVHDNEATLDWIEPQSALRGMKSSKKNGDWYNRKRFYIRSEIYIY